MARDAVATRGVSISLACTAFQITEICYPDESKRRLEDEFIAEWLTRLTEDNRNWGFGVSFLDLRKVKQFGWNHKRVCRIYRELELICAFGRRSAWFARSYRCLHQHSSAIFPSVFL
jgi:putative transposase